VRPSPWRRPVGVSPPTGRQAEHRRTCQVRPRSVLIDCSPRVTDFNLTFGGGRVTGQRVGSPRVSGFGQNPDRQLENLEMDRTFIDMASGKDMHRPQLEALLAFVREGDTVVVHSMDRLARNLDDRRLVKNLDRARGADPVREGAVDLHRGGQHRRPPGRVPPQQPWSSSIQPGSEPWRGRLPKRICVMCFRAWTFRRCCCTATRISVPRWTWPRPSTPRSPRRGLLSCQASVMRAVSRLRSDSTARSASFSTRRR
jgi:hypothetical protein